LHLCFQTSSAFSVRGEKSVQGFGERGWRKETTWNTEAWMGEWLGGGGWSGFSWLRIGTGDGLMEMWWWTFRF
jgi:hypothetical protein